MQQTPTFTGQKGKRIAAKTTLLLALLMFSSTLWAASLQSLRASGAVGEGNNGYVVARKPSAKADADATNRKRKVVYAEKASAQGVSISEVGKVYALEIMNSVPKGTWIQNAQGTWRQK